MDNATPTTALRDVIEVAVSIQQPRHRMQSPVPTKPHIWRHEPVRLFGPAGAWMCANLARSIVKFGARGDSPADAYAAWQKQNQGTGRHG